MTGLEFGFAAGLLALPLAGLPVLLHLLFRRKSPVVPFSTLRFIKTSLQHTAARRRVQRWLLLACRALLLALLVWAISQPAARPASAWTGSGRSTAAVIVLDTSYSMQLQEQQTTLLARADTTVRDLLNNQLHGAKVAILRSSPAPPDRPEAEELRLQEQFRDSAQLRWTTPLPQPAPKPLVDRAALAVQMLEKRDADDKWLVVVSDFQKKEFPRQLPALPGGRVVLIDLHPEDPRTAGITRVALDPPQPTPGANTEAVVDVSGRPGDARQVNVSVLSLDDKAPPAGAPPAGQPRLGRTRPAAFPLQVPARGWLQIDAALQLQEPLAWARSRSLPAPGAAQAARHDHRQPRAGPRPAAGAPRHGPQRGPLARLGAVGAAGRRDHRRNERGGADAGGLARRGPGGQAAGVRPRRRHADLVRPARPGADVGEAAGRAEAGLVPIACRHPRPRRAGGVGEHGGDRRGQGPRPARPDRRALPARQGGGLPLPAAGGDRPARDRPAERLPRHARPRPARPRPGLPQAGRRRHRLHGRDAAAAGVHVAVPEPDVRPDAGADVAAAAGAERRAERGDRPAAVGRGAQGRAGRRSCACRVRRTT